jgi:predicted metal-dependent HD superfamily phosphohydrolase
VQNEKITKDFVENAIIAQGLSEDVVNTVTACYEARHRCYHTLEHVECMLLHVEEPSSALAVSVIFYDIVYHAQPKSPGVNEYQSARLLNSYKLMNTRSMEEAIMATAFYMVDQSFLDPLAKQLCDLDLCNLALPYNDYCYWSDLAIEEAKIIYKDFVKDPMGFRYGQFAFLSKMLQREKLYYIRTDWEVSARENMEHRKNDLEKELVALADTEDTPEAAFYVGFLAGILNRLLVTIDISLLTAKELTTSEKTYCKPELCAPELHTGVI